MQVNLCEISLAGALQSAAAGSSLSIGIEKICMTLQDHPLHILRGVRFLLEDPVV